MNEHEIESYRLNVDNPLFDGLCGGVESSVLYATIQHLKQERDEARRLLREWVVAADNGDLDGVDLKLMVESECVVGGNK